MADQLYFSRDTKVFIEIGSAIWEIPVLDGFSFSQATNSSEVTLSEMESTTGVSRRGRRMFNDSLAPAEWSFSTYMRPFTSAGAADVAGQAAGKFASLTADNHHAVEEALWGLLAGPGYYDAVADDFKSAASGTTYVGHSKNTGAGASLVEGNAAIDFNQSNKSTLGVASMYFAMGGSSDTKTVYKLTGCVVNEATADFDIDGIATINWSGMGATLVDQGQTYPVSTITEGVSATNNFIRNRLTTLSAGKYAAAALINASNQPTQSTRYKITEVGDTNWTDLGASAGTVGIEFVANDQTATGTGTGKAQAESTYGLVLTGGSITITNNITFLTPETIGQVNTPIGHVTGARNVSGSFTCYLNNETDSSAELFEDLISDTATVTNNHRLVFAIGGLTPNLPRVEMTMLDCHLEVPTHSIEDVISLETSFHALPSVIDQTDEITIKYFGRAV